MSNQPVWAFVANLGDVNPVEHGGCFVFRDETGVHPPEMEIWESNHDYGDGDEPEWTVYRFCLDVVGEDEEPWYWDELDKIAPQGVFSGPWVDEVDRMEEALRGEDTLRRALAYRDLVDHYGITSFDDYPLIFTEYKIYDRATMYEHMERAAKVGLSADTPAGIVRDRMIDLGLIRE